MDKVHKAAIWGALGALGGVCGWLVWGQRKAESRLEVHTDMLEAIADYMEREAQAVCDAKFEEIIDLEFDE